VSTQAVTAADGSAHQRIGADRDTYATLGDSRPGLAGAAAEGGWTAGQIRDAQRLAVDFTAREVLDSSVLKGGDTEYRT